MICPQCKDRRHPQCPGGTWCDCQHRGPKAQPQEILVPEPIFVPVSTPEHVDLLGMP